MGLLKASADKTDLGKTFNMHEAAKPQEHKFYELVEDFDREHLNEVDFTIIKEYNAELCKRLHLEPPSQPF